MKKLIGLIGLIFIVFILFSCTYEKKYLYSTGTGNKYRINGAGILEWYYDYERFPEGDPDDKYYYKTGCNVQYFESGDAIRIFIPGSVEASNFIHEKMNIYGIEFERWYSEDEKFARKDEYPFKRYEE